MGKALKNNEDIKLIKEVIKQYNAEQLKKKKAKMFGNTKKLLEVYKQLQSYLLNGLDGLDEELASQLEEMFVGYSSDDDLIDVRLENARKAKVRTFILLKHITRAIQRTEAYYWSKGEHEKFEALEQAFIKGYDFVTVADNLNASEPTVRRWANEVIRESLNIQLYGADGLGFEI